MLTPLTVMGRRRGGAQAWAASFPGEVGSCLEAPSAAPFRPGDGPFTWAGWFYIPGTAADYTPILNVYPFHVFVFQNGFWFLHIRDAGQEVSVYLADYSPGMTPGYGRDRWVFVACGREGNHTWASINAGAKYVSADSTQPSGAFSAPRLMDRTPGQVAQLAYFNTALDASTLSMLCNAGAGRSYSDIALPRPAGLVAWWDFNEESDPCYDAQGSAHFARFGTVTRATGII